MSADTKELLSGREWRLLMLALSGCDPAELSSDILCAVAAMFLDLGAAQIRRDK